MHPTSELAHGLRPAGHASRIRWDAVQSYDCVTLCSQVLHADPKDVKIPQDMGGFAYGNWIDYSGYLSWVEYSRHLLAEASMRGWDAPSVEEAKGLLSDPAFMDHENADRLPYFISACWQIADEPIAVFDLEMEEVKSLGVGFPGTLINTGNAGEDFGIGADAIINHGTLGKMGGFATKDLVINFGTIASYDDHGDDYDWAVFVNAGSISAYVSKPSWRTLIHYNGQDAVILRKGSQTAISAEGKRYLDGLLSCARETPELLDTAMAKKEILGRIGRGAL
jgi:hypothetical protein